MERPVGCFHDTREPGALKLSRVLLREQRAPQVFLGQCGLPARGEKLRRAQRQQLGRFAHGRIRGPRGAGAQGGERVGAGLWAPRNPRRAVASLVRRRGGRRCTGMQQAEASRDLPDGRAASQERVLRFRRNGRANNGEKFNPVGVDYFSSRFPNINRRLSRRSRL